jgi:SAM-dependent methyltransferase
MMSATTKLPDYFANHQYKLRFPWSMYHRPIVSGLAAAMGSSLGPEVLNVGAGPFLELSAIDARDRRITICDTDARAIDAARKLHGRKLVGADVIDPAAPLPYDDGQFDLVVSMDVIEHLPASALLPWLQDVSRVTKPGGLLYLTTPNYASKGLVAIEKTVLEVVARRHGFSRQSLHPSKMTPSRLSELLTTSGWTSLNVQRVALGWVLSVQARKPAQPKVEDKRFAARSEICGRLADLDERPENEEVPLTASA